MGEVFRGGTLEMSTSPLPGLAAGPAWSDLTVNRILAVVSIVLFLLSLPDIFRIAPHLGYALTRSRGAAELEHRLGVARSRNTVARLLLPAFCLMLDRYALIRPAFWSGIPPEWSAAATFGFCAGFLSVRRLCHLVLRPRRLDAESRATLLHNPGNYFIPLTGLMLVSCGIFAFFHAPDPLTSSVLRCECAIAAVLCLFRSGQILAAHCSNFATISYLCRLEVVPAAVLAAVVVFF